MSEYAMQLVIVYTAYCVTGVYVCALFISAVIITIATTRSLSIIRIIAIMIVTIIIMINCLRATRDRPEVSTGV